jgi:hypothetical protein
MKTHNNTRKIDKYYTRMTNHNVETCEKKKQTMTATIKATQPNQKPHKTSSYACQICGCNKGSTCY